MEGGKEGKKEQRKEGRRASNELGLNCSEYFIQRTYDFPLHLLPPLLPPPVQAVVSLSSRVGHGSLTHAGIMSHSLCQDTDNKKWQYGLFIHFTFIHTDIFWSLVHANHFIKSWATKKQETHIPHHKRTYVLDKQREIYTVADQSTIMEFKVFFIKVLSDQSRVLTQTAKGIEKSFKRNFKELDSDRQERSARQCKERVEN